MRTLLLVVIATTNEIVIATIAIGGSLYISETLTTSLAMPRKSSGYATACRGHVAALVRVSSSNPFTGSYFYHLQKESTMAEAIETVQSIKTASDGTVKLSIEMYNALLEKAATK